MGYNPYMCVVCGDVENNGWNRVAQCKMVISQNAKKCEVKNLKKNGVMIMVIIMMFVIFVFINLVILIMRIMEVMMNGKITIIIFNFLFTFQTIHYAFCTRLTNPINVTILFILKICTNNTY